MLPMNQRLLPASCKRWIALQRHLASSVKDIRPSEVASIGRGKMKQQNFLYAFVMYQLPHRPPAHADVRRPSIGTSWSERKHGPLVCIHREAAMSDRHGKRPRRGGDRLPRDEPERRDRPRGARGHDHDKDRDRDHRRYRSRSPDRRDRERDRERRERDNERPSERDGKGPERNRGTGRGEREKDKEGPPRSRDEDRRYRDREREQERERHGDAARARNSNQDAAKVYTRERGDRAAREDVRNADRGMLVSASFPCLARALGTHQQ